VIVVGGVGEIPSPEGARMSKEDMYTVSSILCI